ncbi:MAG: hypothetical protein CMB80_00305 [Flammeovirgaceae bacterium]|nr:hypothetical protein [Flammeovirgaceae bacterium]|tara:strand:+ start:1689 stop:1997 length:309 start_codon:yes stop_codon:yes gene_type:complete
MYKHIMKLENWSVIGGQVHGTRPYTAPELFSGSCLAGEVYNHFRFQDGEPVRTSMICKVKGRRITTHSGHVYELGKIHPDYRQFLKHFFPNWDWRNPVKMKK